MPAALLWVLGGVFWLEVMAWTGMFVCEARCVAGVGGCDEVGLCEGVPVML
jgi:hypothetical protein